jgi:nucleoside-diphosphate kinase
MDRTLILVKPDAFARHMTGEIIARFERKGLRLAALKMMTVPDEMAREHYGEHEGRDFFEPLVTFITSGPIVAMILEGPNAIDAARQLIGSTDGVKAAPGSIRGDYALEVRRNLVHGSDSLESAAREIKIFFGD